ncbi:MAG: hypothetical protein HY881_12120 [Deltaproteobacteria bacterium]|nr:hypothetical protein [Deltaproteobacteria bacterium]
MQLSVKYKIALGCILLILTVQYGLMPLYDWREAAIAHILKLNRSVARKKDLLSHVSDIKDGWQLAMERLQEIERYYQTGFSDPQALQLGLQKKVEKICSEAGVKILNMDWLPVSEGDVIQAPIKLRLEVVPDMLYKILCDMENDALFYSIDILRITARPNAETLTVELDMSSYGIKDAPSIKAGKGRS